MRQYRTLTLTSPEEESLIKQALTTHTAIVRSIPRTTGAKSALKFSVSPLRAKHKVCLHSARRVRGRVGRNRGPVGSLPGLGGLMSTLGSWLRCHFPESWGVLVDHYSVDLVLSL